MSVVGSVMEALVRRPFQLSNSEAAWFLKANGAATVLLSLGAGWLSDRMGRRIPLLTAALVGTGLLTAALPFVTSWPLLLVVRFAQGCFDTTAQVVLLAWVVDQSAPEHQGRSLGVVTGGLPLAYLIGPAMAAQFGEAGLRTLFVILGGGLLLVAVFILFQRESPVARRMPTSGEQLSLRRLWVPIGFGMIDKFTFAGFALLTSLMVKDRFGLDSVSGSGVLLVAFWSAFVVGLYPAIRLCERFGAAWMMGMASVLYGLGYGLLGVLDYRSTVATMAYCGILSGLMYLPALTLVGRLAPAGARGAAMGLFNTTGTLAMIAGFGVLGAASDRSYALAWGLGGVLEVIAGIGLVVVLVARGGGELAGKQGRS